MNFSSTYERHHRQIFSIYRKPIDPPSSEESLENFLQRAGIQERNLEGHSREPHRQYFQKIIELNPWIQRVVEIGFNAGHSAKFFFEALPENGIVFSFDILAHNYVYYAKLYLDTKYPGRHFLEGGDSNLSVPSFASNFNPRPFDLIFIDGDHTEEKAYNDIVNMKQYSIPGYSLIIMDNVAPHCGFGSGVYKAWKRAIDERLIIHLSHIEIDDYRDGWAVFTYAAETYPIRFFMPETTDKYIVETSVGYPTFDKICRRIDITELSKKIERARTLDELNIYGGELQRLEAENLDKVDEWARQLYNKKLREFATSQNKQEGRRIK